MKDMIKNELEVYCNKLTQYGEIGWEIKQITPNVIRTLVDEKMYDCLNINYTKLYREVRKANK